MNSYFFLFQLYVKTS